MLLRHLRARDPGGRALRRHDDGLLDIGIGVGLLFGGIISFHALDSLAGLYVALWFPLMLLAKAGVTLPRVAGAGGPPLAPAAYVPVTPILPAFLPAIMALPAYVAAERPALALHVHPWGGPLLPPLLPGLIGAVALCLAGRGLGTRRLYAYAGLTLVAWLVGSALGLEARWPYLVVGPAVAACGGVLLGRFIRAHPPAAPLRRVA